jgi:hypothetical protein
MVFAQLTIVAVSALLGGLILSSARSHRDRAERLSALASDDGTVQRAADAAVETIEGPVEVDAPADPERRPPEHHRSDDPDDAAPALWAWRVRRERTTDSGSHWETVESGLATGEWTVRENWDRVRVDAAGLAGDVDDPFAADRLFLGDPEVDVYVEERDGLLGKLGGDYGPLKDVEISVGVGSKTTTPDKYQATVIREGDELLARGRLDERDGEQVLHGGDEGALELAVGDLGERAERISRSARRRAVVGASVLLLGVAGAGASLLV